MPHFLLCFPFLLLAFAGLVVLSSPFSSLSKKKVERGMACTNIYDEYVTHDAGCC